MKNEILKKYYLDGGCNCAEAVLRAANEQFGLGLDESALRLAGGFGGGMASGSSCGALCGAIQALGAAMLTGRAKECPGFREKCAAYFSAFNETLGGTDCSVLTPIHKCPETKCAGLVEKAYELLEDALKQ